MGVQNKFLKDIRWRLAGTLILVGGSLFCLTTDLLVAKLFGRLRPELERELSKSFGHSLVIGPYMGLRPWGIGIGPTRLADGLKDDSTADLSGLTVKYAPIASLFNWRPVIALNLKGTNLRLRLNDDGAYWVAKSSNEKPPKIGLLVRLDDPAEIYLQPSNLKLIATSNLFLNLQKSKATGSFQLGVPNKGSVFLKGSGSWNQLELKARATFKNFRVKQLKSIFWESSKTNAQGKIDGDLQLKLADGVFDCKGGVSLADFSLHGGLVKEYLSSKKATINCRHQQFVFPKSDWKYGPLLSSIDGDIDLRNKRKFNLALRSSIRLEEVSSSELNVDANLPFTFDRGLLTSGEFSADLNLKPFPLSSIGSLIGTSMAGTIASTGKITGPLNALNTNLSIEVVNPQLNGIRLQEEWQGGLNTRGGEDVKLEMESVGASVPGSLLAYFKNNMNLEELTFKRFGGQLLVKRDQDSFSWHAKDLRLDRVEVAIPPEKSFKRIFGQFSGKGTFGLQPVFVDGQLTMRYPRLMGLRLDEATIRGTTTDDTFNVNAELFPPKRGVVVIDAEGYFGGALNARAKASGVSANWITDSAFQFPKISMRTTSARGRAEDLGELIVRTFGESLDGRLELLAQAQASYLKINDDSKYKINREALQGDIDAVVLVNGDDINDLNLDLELSGQLWLKGKKNQIDYQGEPFVAKITGPIQGGTGQFSILNVPFSLLSLVAPIPTSLTGMFGLSGEYRRGKQVPELSAKLSLQDASLAKNQFVLDRGNLSVSRSIVDLDILLRSTSSSEPLKLIGQLPLDTSTPIDLRIESHGDGLRFLEGLTDGVLFWKRGTADLRFLIRGTLDDLKANGFLVIRRGEFIVYENVVEKFNAAMLFDFNRLELLNFEARIGDRGKLGGSGAIPLFRPQIIEKNPLIVEMKKVPFELPFINLEFASNIMVKGSLSKPQVGGDLSIKNGFISPPKQVSQNTRTNQTSNKFTGKKGDLFPEWNWDMNEPLNLSVRDLDTPSSKLMRSSISSKFSNISFDNLRLRIGPGVQINTPPNAFTRQPLAIFDASGLLTFNGALDETLNASGVVRLMKGRVNLFTTTFQLDRSKTNVAIFSPSKGFIPFLDVTMTSRIPDKVKSIENIESTSDFSTNGSGAFGIGGSRLIKVEVVAIGPADRIADNFKLTSRPSMPRKELIGLLGGSSLDGIFGGATASLSNVIGSSFISPFLGNVSDSFSERMQIFLYSTNIISSPKGSKEAPINDQNEIDEQEQAWVTDIGIDLNKKFNFSLQAIPNRSDVPPQGTLRYEINPNLDALGTLDMEGNWQSQLQLFLRY